MDTLNLLQILEVFNAPINEEQAWAVCYQCAKYLQKAWSERSVDNGLPCFSCLDAVVLSKDGTVFRVVDSGDNGKRAIPFLPTHTSRPKPFFSLDVCFRRCHRYTHTGHNAKPVFIFGQLYQWSRWVWQCRHVEENKQK